MLTLVDGVEFLSNRCIHGLQDFITPISFLGGTEAIMRGTDDGSWRILCALPVFQVQMLHPSGQAVVVKIVPLDWLCMCINQRKKRRFKIKLLKENWIFDLDIHPTKSILCDS